MEEASDRASAYIDFDNIQQKPADITIEYANSVTINQVDFLNVRDESGKVHKFKPVVIENETCAFDGSWVFDAGYFYPTTKCIPNDTYRLEWQHIGEE